MHEAILHPGWETVLVAVPFVGLLLVSLFGLDRILAAPRPGTHRRRPATGFDKEGEPLLCDPDGRRCRKPRRGK
jgi:hypothetical protein